MSRRAPAVSGRNYPWSGGDPERRNAVLLVVGIGVVVLLALGIAAFGYYKDRIQPKHATVLTVGQRKFDYAYLERRAKAEVISGRMDASNPAQAVLNTLSRVETDELVRQTAIANNVTATESEVDKRLKERLGLSSNASRDDVAIFLRRDLLASNFSLGEYREIVVAEVVETKMKDSIRAAIPNDVEKADILLIQTETRGKAEEALQRLKDGEGFNAVAVSLSTHPTAKKDGGSLGPIARGALPQPLEHFAFDVGGLSDVIALDENHFFVMVSRGKDTVPTTDTDRQQIVGQTYTDMLQKTRDAIGSDPRIRTEQVQALATSVINAAKNGQRTAPPTGQPESPVVVIPSGG